MSVPKLKPFSGWPFNLGALVNLVVARINRPWEFRYDTTSLNPIAKVDETEEKVTVTLSRGFIQGLPKPDDDEIYLLGYEGKVLKLFATQECEDDDDE